MRRLTREGWAGRKLAELTGTPLRPTIHTDMTNIRVDFDGRSELVCEAWESATFVSLNTIGVVASPDAAIIVRYDEKQRDFVVLWEGDLSGAALTGAQGGVTRRNERDNALWLEGFDAAVAMLADAQGALEARRAEIVRRRGEALTMIGEAA